MLLKFLSLTNVYNFVSDNNFALASFFYIRVLTLNSSEAKVAKPAAYGNFQPFSEKEY